MERILVVDDSAVVRRYLARLLEREGGYRVETARNGVEALEALARHPYDLVTLDVEMPELDGLQTLRKIMRQHPTRVLMVSAFTTEGSETTFEALEAGALDYIPKPGNSLELPAVSREILQKVESALAVPLKKIAPTSPPSATPSFSARHYAGVHAGYVLIGASTGGPRLIERICRTLPADYPHTLCVVQHMPENFTAGFARRLDTLSRVEVREAKPGLALRPGRVIIAKGGRHLRFRRDREGYCVELTADREGRLFVPSVDEMFFSAAETLPARRVLAIELTGIGDDGADGLVALRKQGALTIAESEASAVVYGMPKEAARRGGAKKILDFEEILKEIVDYGLPTRSKRT